MLTGTFPRQHMAKRHLYTSSKLSIFIDFFLPSFMDQYNNDMLCLINLSFSDKRLPLVKVVCLENHQAYQKARNLQKHTAKCLPSLLVGEGSSGFLKRAPRGSQMSKKLTIAMVIGQNASIILMQLIENSSSILKLTFCSVLLQNKYSLN